MSIEGREFKVNAEITREILSDAYAAGIWIWDKYSWKDWISYSAVTNRVVEGGCHVFDARVMISELAEQGSSHYSK